MPLRSGIFGILVLGNCKINQKCRAFDWPVVWGFSNWKYVNGEELGKCKLKMTRVIATEYNI